MMTNQPSSNDPEWAPRQATPAAAPWRVADRELAQTGGGKSIFETIFGVFIFLAMVVVGLVLTCLGLLLNAVAIYGNSEARTHTSETVGRITSVEDYSACYERDGGHCNQDCTVKYVYEVKGQTVSGEEKLSTTYSGSTIPQSCDEMLGEGKQVPVYYDPNNVSDASLEKLASLRFALIFGLPVLGAGLALLISGVVLLRSFLHRGQG